jgi:hypothetical protein
MPMMTQTPSSPSRSISYPPKTMARAERAVRCAPFQLSLFATMRYQGVGLGTIAGAAGVQQGYTRRAIAELMVEDELVWLIQVGMLRREVDGQGLTDSFRLTPLGRQLVERWERQSGLRLKASWMDRVLNALNRWMRIPDWL